VRLAGRFADEEAPAPALFAEGDALELVGGGVAPCAIGGVEVGCLGGVSSDSEALSPPAMITTEPPDSSDVPR